MDINRDIIRRLKVIMNYYNLTQSELAARIDVHQPNISAILRGERSCGTGIINKILLSFDINKDWLLNGEGDMLNDATTTAVSPFSQNSGRNPQLLIPLVHIDSVGGINSPNALDSSEQYVEQMVPFPNARTGDVAILQSGNSMAPTIPAGAILQIRRVDNWQEYFGYGSDFVLWLKDDRRITKQVLKYGPDSKHYVTCHSYNPEAADEELPKSMIREVWKVVNVLINKGW